MLYGAINNLKEAATVTSSNYITYLKLLFL